MSILNTSTACLKKESSTLCDQGLLRGSLGLAAVSVVVFGVLYSLAGVGLGQAIFPLQANGSLIERGGQVIGSSLVAQPFAAAGYFQPRPSAAGYKPMEASGSNQARTNPELRHRLEAEVAAIAAREGVSPSQVPSDLATESGAGFDPHISPAAAAIQIQRVARNRALDPKVVTGLVEQHTQAAQFGGLGQPRVNVLELNLALDQLARGVAR